ncbi:MAG: STAS domain-containing protein [Simkaniaceae bacterium]|nr:STAS domain-containing protein [Simkaniaceae bacterium]
MAVGLQIEVSQKEGKTIVSLQGRIDATSTPQLEDKLAEIISAGGKHIIIDFAKVEYLSSAGMRLMLSNTKKLKSEAGNLVFCAINEDVMEIIKMAGFEKILSIYGSEDEALKAS